METPASADAPLRARVRGVRDENERHNVRTVVCIGDSITYARAMRRNGVERSWVEQLATAIERETGSRLGDGFHGLWRNEWKRTGGWIQAQRTDLFDVAPFRHGFYSSGVTADEVTWTKPANTTVESFSLYWFYKADMGRWQYRIDDGPWTNIEPPGPPGNKLHRSFVPESVHSRVSIRGHDGQQPCVATIVGIATYDTATTASGGAIVHNLGYQLQMLAVFCRPSAGDPLALLDDLRPDLTIVFFSNDVRLHKPSLFAANLRCVVERVRPRSDVMLICPFEQRVPRVVADVVTNVGSPVVSSNTALFLGTDLKATISGTNIPEGAQIQSVASTTQAIMSAPAVGSCARGELAIGGPRDVVTQAEYRAVTSDVARETGCALLDLHDAWAASIGAGWRAAWDAGFMHDGLHPSQRGHDVIALRVCEALGLRDLPSRRRK